MTTEKTKLMQLTTSAYNQIADQYVEAMLDRIWAHHYEKPVKAMRRVERRVKFSRRLKWEK